MSGDFAIEVWPADSRQITQPFGANPDVYKQFGAPGHTGIDLGGTEGATKIYAVADGKVSKIGRAAQFANGFGNHIYIRHDNGYSTIYGHLHQINVRQGANVTAGTVIGTLGNTGFSTGPHLHFELRGPKALSGWPRNIIDPTPFLAPHMGFNRPSGPFKEGWIADWVVTILGDLAQAAVGGVSLRSGPGTNFNRLDVVPEGSVVIITERQNGFLKVQVPTATVGAPAPTPPKPAPDFPPMVSTVMGWGFANYITADSTGVRGTIGQYGINLRADPRRDGINIGVVGGGAEITITGTQVGEYLPIKAARNDFIGQINMVQASPAKPSPGVLSAHSGAEATTCLGWGWTAYLELRGDQAIAGQFGLNLRSEPNEFAAPVGVVKGLSVVTIAGKPDGDYTPILVDRTDMLTVASPTPRVQKPKATRHTAASPLPIPPPTAPQDSTPGWGFTSAMTLQGATAVAGQYGINLRANPRRNAENIGFVPAQATVIVVGSPQGEYTPVRVNDVILQPPFGTTPIQPDDDDPTPIPPAINNPETPILGRAKIGLHASATPDISNTEIGEFGALRPGMIKVLSFHDPQAIKKLVTNHPDAAWVVRAFLDFGGRNISPQQFVNDTISDTKRTLDILRGKDVVVELHNEPNLTPEGLNSSWRDGSAFNLWWLEVLGQYRQKLPSVRYIFPGLSPGPSQAGLRQADRPFLEACRPAINAADGLAMHAYWSNPHFPMLGHADSGTQLVDDYIRRFPNKHIWITEASNNLGHEWHTKTKEYMQFWQEMLKRPSVQGVTFFVASDSTNKFPHEVWLGNGIAAKLGAR